jgi:MFS family permease
MRVGVQFVRQSPRMRAVLWRIATFFLHATALLALLPLLAQRLDARGGGWASVVHGATVTSETPASAATFTLLLAAMGAGAMIATLFLPRWRQALGRDVLVLRGTLAQASATGIMAIAPHIGIAAPAMFLAGMAWITSANTLSVSAQLALPNWVRARGMSVYQMAIMGATAFGAAIWGHIASMTSLPISVGFAAVSGVAAMLLVQRWVKDRSIEEDLSPSTAWKAPTAAHPPGAGKIIVTIEYLIQPEKGPEFVLLMQESKRSRLRQGALHWQLLHDITEPQKYVEYIEDESWVEHLRRFDRVTASDVALRERKLAFHTADTPPVVHRYVVEQR